MDDDAAERAVERFRAQLEAWDGEFGEAVADGGLVYVGTFAAVLLDVSVDDEDPGQGDAPHRPSTSAW